MLERGNRHTDFDVRLDHADLLILGNVQERDVREIAGIVVTASDQCADGRASARHQDVTAVNAQSVDDNGWRP